MMTKYFIGVFVLLILIIIILIIISAKLLKHRKRRNNSGSPKDPESAEIGQEHVEFASNRGLQNRMQTAHIVPPSTRASMDITTRGSSPQLVRHSRSAARSSSEQWRRRGIELSTCTPAAIPEESDLGQERMTMRQSRGSATPIADSFIRRSRIGIAKTTPYAVEESSSTRPRLSLNTMHAIASHCVEKAPPAKQGVSVPERKSSRFQEQIKSPENQNQNQWHDVELSPPPTRQSMQSSRASSRASFESKMPASWGKPVPSRFPLD